MRVMLAGMTFVVVASVVIGALSLPSAPLASPYTPGVLSAPAVETAAGSCTNRGCVRGNCGKRGSAPGSNCKVSGGGNCIQTSC